MPYQLARMIQSSVGAERVVLFCLAVTTHDGTRTYLGCTFAFLSEIPALWDTQKRSRIERGATKRNAVHLHYPLGTGVVQQANPTRT